MGTQQFCLRWNNHQLNMLNVFESLLQNEALVDVTLACDGLTLKAHKVVLSACSPYFQSLFIDNPCKHPIVILKDVRYCDLKALIDFMYKGEVNVGQDQLNALLNTAESLKIKGLAEVTGGGASCTNATLEPHVPPTLINRLNQSSNVSNSTTSSPPPPSSGSASHQQNSHTNQHSGGNSLVVDALKTPPNMPPLLQPLCNASSSVRFGLATTSPPPKRRKTKPRKRVPESAMISSDQEDSDALDLASATPEMIETCVDLPPGDNLGPESSDNRYSDGSQIDVKPNLPLDAANQAHHQHHSFQAESTSIDDNPSPDNKLDYPYADVNRSIAVFPQSLSTNQNQFPCAIPSSLLASQRLGPIIPKPPLSSSLPPASLSPAPSTSATEATIQDPPGWSERKKREYHCEHCQASFESKKVFYKHGCPRVRVGFTCDVCGSYFPTHCRYSRHRQIHNPDREIYTCYYCPKTMVRMDHLKQHMKTAHGLGFFAPDEIVFSAGSSSSTSGSGSGVGVARSQVGKRDEVEVRSHGKNVGDV